MNISFLITDLYLGGSPLMLRDLALGLHNTGDFQISIISLKPLPPENQSAFTIPDPNFSVHSPLAPNFQLPTSNFQIHSLNLSSPLHFPRALPRLIHLLNNTSPHVIFSILIHANLLARLAIPFVRSNPRFIQSIHTLQPRPRWHWTLQRILAPLVHALIAPSQPILDRIGTRTQKPLPLVIPNGIDVDRFAHALPIPNPPWPTKTPPGTNPTESRTVPPNQSSKSAFKPDLTTEFAQKNAQSAQDGAPNTADTGNDPCRSNPGESVGHSRIEQPPTTPNSVTTGGGDKASSTATSPIKIIGYVGRFDPVKRLDLLLHTLARLHQSPNSSENASKTIWHLALVGYGPDEAPLKTLSNSLHLTPFVHFIPQTRTPERWYKSFDCLCLPSSVEGFGLVLAEALAAGIPVVAPRTPVTASLFNDPAHGRLVSPPTPELLTQAIQSVTTNPPDPIILQTHIRNHFSTALMVKRYEKFLKDFSTSPT